MIAMDKGDENQELLFWDASNPSLDKDGQKLVPLSFPMPMA